MVTVARSLYRAGPVIRDVRLDEPLLHTQCRLGLRVQASGLRGMLRRELEHYCRQQQLHFWIETSHAVATHLERMRRNVHPSPDAIEIHAAARGHKLEQTSGPRQFRTNGLG